MLGFLVGVLVGIAADRKYPQPVDFVFRSVKSWWNGVRRKADSDGGAN